MPNPLPRFLRCVHDLCHKLQRARCADECYLLALPAELRNMIWHFACTDAPHIEIGTRQIPATLIICKQMREEMYLMYYALGCYAYTDHGHLRQGGQDDTASISRWLADMRINQKEITHLELRLDGSSRVMPRTFSQHQRNTLPNLLLPEIRWIWHIDNAAQESAEGLIYSIWSSQVPIKTVAIELPFTESKMTRKEFRFRWRWAIELFYRLGERLPDTIFVAAGGTTHTVSFLRAIQIVYLTST
ncbi:hypothetical protein CLAFUW4_07526 [Fulvia fulva]|uniref:2EXR domain-containing protein n=1 Tax=Passalora fulva TaxID=5499 RepID=A0A9Q8UQP4_PASFU|nr:uncharacterized protein CLAFUR5_07656 [Fulvia fulva]KAK4621342.1 hypothetical protein CLAFUR4_07532 [Fulvia fulva]KAK4623299.1 hypothetical protein CLAFUR0_07531 [Fulvia fulva]UJO18882.1 hypothetical protein CLAFUR5_07656 [Fulvia fulva]WPV15670.1 hypothetical protein CLAFUW4_07526 [Fulvia fulva]WPV31437.1 hypothetical protein CLAFUW7_07528 [Fulvia fulva]